MLSSRAASMCVKTSLLSNHPNVRRRSFCARSASPSMRESRVIGVYDALYARQVASSLDRRQPRTERGSAGSTPIITPDDECDRALPRSVLGLLGAMPVRHKRGLGV